MKSYYNEMGLQSTITVLFVLAVCLGRVDDVMTQENGTNTTLVSWLYLQTICLMVNLVIAGCA